MSESGAVPINRKSSKRRGRTRQAFLLGWVSIEPKQTYQVKSLIQLGYLVTIVTNDHLGRSLEVTKTLADDLRIFSTGNARIKKALVIARALMSASRYDIAFIPCASRMSAAIVALCRVRQLRTIVIEWGDIAVIETLPRLTRWNMRASYRLASAVWFKEPYMRDLLRNFHAHKPFYLPNAIQASPVSTSIAWHERDIDFVWVNRVVRVRYPLWLAQSVHDFADSERPSAVIAGLLPRDRCDTESWNTQQQLLTYQDLRLRILPYGDPAPIYARGRFFVLAADHVFGNNALLEAMSAGLVPIVSESPDVGRIVTDGYNGLVFENSQEGLSRILHRAMSLSPQRWQEMSVNAQRTVKQSFNPIVWQASLQRLIQADHST